MSYTYLYHKENLYHELFVAQQAPLICCIGVTTHLNFFKMCGYDNFSNIIRTTFSKVVCLLQILENIHIRNPFNFSSLRQLFSKIVSLW